MKTFIVSLMSAFILTTSVFAVVFDGMNITGDFANAAWKTYQDVSDDWGGNSIVAMYIDTNETHLLVGIPGYVNNNAVGLFLDVNPGTGSNVMPAGLTMPDSICAGMAGMSFDTIFTPDMALALRTPDQSSDSNGWPAIENIVTDSRTWLGLLNDIRNFGSVVTNGDTIFSALMTFPPFLSETDTFSDGIELAISYDDLNNSSPTVRVMAIGCNNDGGWASNQTLPPSGGNSNWVSNPSADHHADLVPGDQYLTILLPVYQTGVQFYANASVDKTLGFAESTVFGFSSVVSGATPPIFYDWDLGNAADQTNVDAFSYSYPGMGDFIPSVIISDSGGNSKTVTLAQVKVYASTFVDGLNITNDFAGKGTNALQDTVSNWGEATIPGTGAQLEQLFAYCESNKLFVGISGNLTTGIGERTIGIFIDSDYNVGSNVMPVITAGSPAKLQNLAGMTFDSDFTPDKAILISINSPADCWVNVYHIDSNSDWYWGEKAEYSDIFDPYQQIVNDRSGLAGDIVAFNDLNTAANPEDANTGAEYALDAETIYFGLAPAQSTLKVQAILFNWQTTNVANQSLPGINGNSSGYGLASAVNYENVPGKQYIEVCAPIPEPIGFWICLLWSALIKLRHNFYKKQSNI